MGNSSSANTPTVKANGLWDSGSTLSLITKTLAKLLKLRGKTVFIAFDTVNGAQSFESVEYVIKVKDLQGNMVELVVQQIEKISSQINHIDRSIVEKLFPELCSMITYPSEGAIDLLIGMRYAGYQPVNVKAHEHLLAMQNRFGTLVAGWHQSFNSQVSIEPAVLHMRNGVVMHSSGSIVERFFEIESLGVTCKPECGGCRCGKCHPGGKNMTLAEEKEYNVMKANVSFNSDSGRYCTKYPWTEDRKNLVYNETMAFAVMRSTERQLKRKGEEYSSMYTSQIHDMLDRKAARRITTEELRNFKGQKYYITHLMVEKQGSKSTPWRIVFNSSARYKGYSVNDCSMKGPSLLNSLFGVLLRFREEVYAFVGDLAKMFHSIDMPVEDQMMHLFMWRDNNENVKPEIYAMTVLNMGDRPSAAIAQICLKDAAEKSFTQYPESSLIIADNSYMDDILGSVGTTEERELRIHEITNILKERGFNIKEWVKNDDTTNKNDNSLRDILEPSETFMEDVLGYQWKFTDDKLVFKVDLPIDEVRSVTRRNILRTLNGFYDPFGLISPFLVIGKIILRTVYATVPDADWDDPLPDHIANEWKKFLKEVPSLSKLSFNRSFKPQNTVGKPQLVIFSDGAKNAYGAVAYARWKLKDGRIECRLISAKNRVAPLKIENIVRLELCGALLGCRLRESAISELKNTEFEKVIHIVDSEIVHGMVNKDSYGFNTFVSNRLGDIHRTSSGKDFVWTPGGLNISDIITRGCTPAELGKDSEWQNGPKFLKLEEECWPVKHDVNENIELPERKKTNAFVGHLQVVDSLSTRINPLRFSKWQVLVNTTARIFDLYRRFKHNNEKIPLSQAMKDKAEKFWIKHVQKELDPKSKQLIKLHPTTNKDGIMVVGGRTERWREATWNEQFFTILPGKNHISLLIARYEHALGGHVGRDATISKIRAKYWILGIRGLVEKIVENCTLCKAKLERLLQQQMAPLPAERLLLKPCPGFTYVMIDYFGPFDVVGEVQKRTKGKCYGLIFTCLSTRAVYVDITPDYTTTGFMFTLRRFASIRGWPTKIFSDKGSQLQGASTELFTVINNLDWKDIEEESQRAGRGTEWKFSPADAPWYNGAVEALVKTTKRALTVAIGVNKLKPLEMQTYMFEAAQLVNQRPIGKHPTNPSDGVYMSPNDLLLGRSTPAIPQGPFKERCSFRFRFDFIQTVVESFWKRWIQEVFPNLVIWPKWHTEQRNLKVGDVVLLQDSNALRGQWKKAVVEEATVSSDGKVRHVRIRYRSKENKNIVIDRPVQRLILLVPVDDTE